MNTVTAMTRSHRDSVYRSIVQANTGNYMLFAWNAYEWERDERLEQLSMGSVISLGYVTEYPPTTTDRAPDSSR